MINKVESEDAWTVLFDEEIKRAESGNVKWRDIEFTFCVNLGALYKRLKEHHINRIIFSSCKFLNGIFCRGADYSSCAFALERCIIAQTADFTKSRFKEISFEKSMFRDTASFIDARFEEINFNNAEFAETVILKRAVFPSKTHFYDVKFCGTVELAGFTCEELIFDRCKIYGAMEFTDGENDKINFHALALPDTKISGFFDLKWKEYAVKDLILKAQEDPTAIAKQFAVLKEVYHQIGDYDAEDEAFIACMDYRAKAGGILKRFLYTVLKWIGAYGTSPSRIGATMIGMIMISIGVYAIASFIPGSGINGVKCIFSMGLFGAIGMGNFETLHWAAMLYGFVESIFGLFLFSYFSVALVRRTLR